MTAILTASLDETTGSQRRSFCQQPIPVVPSLPDDPGRAIILPAAKQENALTEPDNTPFFVPHKYNPNFVGRTDDLENLHAALQGQIANNGGVGIIPAGVTGMGGIGKTQLAVRYAYDYRAHYPDGIYWLTVDQKLEDVFARFGQDLWQIMAHRHSEIAAGRLETLARLIHTLFDPEEFNTLCFELTISYEDIEGNGLARTRNLVDLMRRQNRLDELNNAIQQKRPDLVRQPQELLLKLAFDYLRQNERSLLILDNVQEPDVLNQPVSRDWIPARLPHLLFTTRRRDVGHFRSVELTVLPEDVALKLLLRHPRRQPILVEQHPEHQTAQAICAQLGYLPLALEIAGAHLGKQSRQPLQAYFDELQKRGAIGVLDDKRMPVTPAVHEAGVAAVLDSQFLSLESGEAKMMLRIAGLFSEAAQIPATRLGLLAGLPEESESF
ncbi:MAG: NB-ARC domain-containing protein, partial [Anaerolineae bacterium]